MPRSRGEANPFVYLLMFVVFGFIAIMSFSYILNIVPLLNIQTAPGVEDTVNYSVSSNWDDSGYLDNMETDGDLIYPAVSSSGSWTSEIIDVPRNRVLYAYYGADITEGNGTLTVNAWRDPPNGSEPDVTETVNLSTGENREVFNLTEQNYFEVRINLTENMGSNNFRPNVDYIDLEYEIIEGEYIGISSTDMLPIVISLMFFSFLMLVTGTYTYLGLED